MLYRSEILKKDFKTEEDCLKAEEDYNNKIAAANERAMKLREERADRAKEVEAAFNKVTEAEKEYIKLRNQFVKDYGYYHQSFKEDNSEPFTSLFDMFFRLI